MWQDGTVQIRNQDGTVTRLDSVPDVPVVATEIKEHDD